MEGIMMRGPKLICCAVRKPDGTIETKLDPVKTHGIWAKIPLVRGTISMIESLIVGYRYMMYSAQVSMGDDYDPEEEETAFEKWVGEHFGQKAEDALLACAAVVGGLLAILLFTVLPTAISPSLVAIVYPPQNSTLDAFLFHTPVSSTPSSVSKAVIKVLPSTGIPRAISRIRRRTPVAEASAAAPETVRVLSVAILIALLRSPVALASAGAPEMVRVGSVVTRPSVSLANCSARLADSAAAALELSAASACCVAVSACCVAMPACCSAA